MEVIYTAKNYSGQTKGGEAVVKDERDLVNQLRADGFVVTSFKIISSEENRTKIKFLDRFFSVPIRDKMVLIRNLSIMISSGVTISRALKNITEQTRNKKLAKILERAREDLQTGTSLSNAFSKYPGVFNELLVNMIRVGETAGNLEEVLTILATQLEKDYELKSRVKGAMIYPAVILIAMVGIGALMMIYVVPQVTKVLEDLGSELPYSTQMIISISDTLRNHYILVIAGMAFLIAGGKLFLTLNIGRKTMGMFLIYIPFIKNIVIKLNCARFSRIYSSLLKSGVPVVEALQILSRTLTNFYYSQAMIRTSENIQKGVNLSKLIAQENKIFPALVSQMIEVGEETGKTEAVLLKLAEFYEEEINQLTKNMSSIVEPVLMIIIGSAVGFFAVSILQPMYSVLEDIK